MDEHMRLYFEDAYDFLQNAEEALIRLESGYSKEDINQLFRSAHSIKGSSASVGFDEIASLTHKAEDMLDYVRKGVVELDKYLINLCFETFDTVKNLLDNRYNASGKELPLEIIFTSQSLEKAIDEMLKNNTCDQKTEPLILNFIRTTGDYSNSFYVHIVFEKEAEMLSVRRFMLINAIKDMGTIEYSQPSVEAIAAFDNSDEASHCRFIISTDRNEGEVYQLLDIGEIEIIKVMNVSSYYIESNEISFSRKDVEYFSGFFENFKSIASIIFDVNEPSLSYTNLLDEKWFKDILEYNMQDMKLRMDARRLLKYKEDIRAFFEVMLLCFRESCMKEKNTLALLQKMYIDILKEMYTVVENKIIFRTIKIHDSVQLESLSTFADQIDKSSFKSLIVDISQLDMVEPEGIRVIMQTKRKLAEYCIGLFLINNGIYRKRIYNIFDSLDYMDKLILYYSEIEAIIGFNWGNKRKYFKQEGSNNE